MEPETPPPLNLQLIQEIDSPVSKMTQLTPWAQGNFETLSPALPRQDSHSKRPESCSSHNDSKPSQNTQLSAFARPRPTLITKPIKLGSFRVETPRLKAPAPAAPTGNKDLIYLLQ